MLDKKLLEIQGLCFVVHRDWNVDQTEEDFLARFWWIHNEMQKSLDFSQRIGTGLLKTFEQESKKRQIQKLFQV